MNDRLLEVDGLIKRYDGRAVVNELGFFVRRGEIVGLLGRNGAGKTTTFRLTVGMIDAEQGSVVFDGLDVTSLAMYKRAQLGMGYLSQEPSVFQRLSVEDNLLAILETMREYSRRDRMERAAPPPDPPATASGRSCAPRSRASGRSPPRRSAPGRGKWCRDC